MIVISGVLVLVALILLVIGVVQEALPFVYTSIGVSLVSLLFLLVGILQRRKEPLPDAGGSGSPAAQADRPSVDVSDGATPVAPSSRRITSDEPAPVAAAAPVAEEPPVADTVDEEPQYGGVVLVVSGRPRYHIEGCRYLGGKQAEEVDVLDARDEGFTPCGVCRPDDVLADEPADEPLDDTTSALPVVQEPEPVDEEPVAPVRPARRAAASRASSAASARETAAAPAARKATRSRGESEAPATRAVTAPAKRTPATKAAAPAPVPAKAAGRAPSKAAAAAADGTPAAATARRAGSVVVIPERGRFHRAECRYVRGVDGAEVLTKGQATKQGYEACGVCKP